MSGGVNRFYNSLPDAANIPDKELVGLFAYFLTVEAAEESATARTIEDCYRECDLTPSSRIAPHLSEGVRANKFIKVDRGYKLQRHFREELSNQLGTNHTTVQTNAELRRLEGRMSAGSKKAFLKETLDCFEAGANRATIIMCWILAIDHLSEYVFGHHLNGFNSELSKVTDKRVRVTKVQVRDDFGDIPENKFIELLRSANIISNDVRKILEEKLGIRNSCAHPSGIAIKPSKVVEFVDDLIENVVLKYPV